AHGCLLHQLGDLPAAKLRLEQARELDPHDIRALVELGLVWEAMGQPDRALDCYQRALDEDPHQDDVIGRVNRLQAQGVKRPLPTYFPADPTARWRLSLTHCPRGGPPGRFSLAGPPRGGGGGGPAERTPGAARRAVTTRRRTRRRSTATAPARASATCCSS